LILEICLGIRAASGRLLSRKRNGAQGFTHKIRGLMIEVNKPETKGPIDHQTEPQVIN
jgi:hypothetical protein